MPSPWITNSDVFHDESVEFTVDEMKELRDNYRETCKTVADSIPSEDRDGIRQILDEYSKVLAERHAANHQFGGYWRFNPNGTHEERVVFEKQVHALDKKLKDMDATLATDFEPYLQNYPPVLMECENELLVATVIHEIGGIEQIKKDLASEIKINDNDNDEDLQKKQEQQEQLVTEGDMRNLHALFQNQALLKEMILQGGPRGGKWHITLRIYLKLIEMLSEDDPYYPSHSRVAMAVALEFAMPIRIFDTEIAIDPVERFQDYTDAHKRGDLDPSFSYFTTFEYRHVINTIASKEDLQWGRELLYRYRPGYVCKDEHFRYTKASKSDLIYRRPVYTQTPNTFKHLIGVGGQCGAKAWFGRFISRANGIPVWGCKQPGHAAMTHWSGAQGWVVCLGDWNFSVCRWLGVNGVDFADDVNSRAWAWNDEDALQEYYQKKVLARCMSRVLEEQYTSNRFGFYHIGRFWTTVFNIQCKLLGTKATVVDGDHIRDAEHPKCQQQMNPADIAKTKFEILHEQITPPPGVDKNEQTTKTDENGCIWMAPASCKQDGFCCKEICYPFFDEATQEVQITMLRDQSFIVKDLPKEDMTHEKGYSITFLICNINIEQRDLIIEVDGEECIRMEIPYTVGEYQWTDPQPLPTELGEGVMKMTRGKGDFPGKPGLTFKFMKLVPNE